MNFLIDTHVLLWYLEGNNSLPARIRTDINNSENNILISIVSFWELAIKLTSGKINTKITLSQIEEDITNREFEILHISFQHLEALMALPKVHGDPFDRLIIAQAISENLTIISADKQFKTYPVRVAW
ncbi:MAG TPA: type II toxin-antitoxin system VapC family toxin [Mucilaginibacter sp.]